MSADNDTKLPLEQELIRAKCFHPKGNFFEFGQAEIEQSIPERFEKMVLDIRSALRSKPLTTA